jgi:hypothetical protein
METAGRHCDYHCSRALLQNIRAQQRSVSIHSKHLKCPIAYRPDHLPRSFDEVHFGKFASRYIKTQYFMDVHPPLAKLLITLAAFMFGYDGNFDFKDIAKWASPYLMI